ncbi:hypothetical protein C1646_758342 [Rhizophagus diaphanus]|nr:hypothetical protein C1646_758342 [Rhizophagus diaphanus] [Rhizophagus sp. MUCL 43196]
MAHIYEVSLIVEALVVNEYNLYWKNNLIVSNLRGWAKKRTDAIWKNEILNCAKIEDLFYYNYRDEFDWIKVWIKRCEEVAEIEQKKGLAEWLKESIIEQLKNHGITDKFS